MRFYVKTIYKTECDTNHGMKSRMMRMSVKSGAAGENPAGLKENL